MAKIKEINLKIQVEKAVKKVVKSKSKTQTPP